MSLSRLADLEISRRGAEGLVRRTREAAQRAAESAPGRTLESVGRGDTGAAEQLAERVAEAAAAEATEATAPPPSGTAFETLVKYVPTESVTLYVAAASATPALVDTFPGFSAKILYWSFVVLTPLILFLIIAGKRSSAQLSPVPSLGEFPWWKLFAAAVAFAVWALSVPDNPYTAGSVATGAVAGFGAVLVSTFLTLLEPIFERPPRPAPV